MLLLCESLSICLVIFVSVYLLADDLPLQHLTLLALLIGDTLTRRFSSQSFFKRLGGGELGGFRRSRGGERGVQRLLLSRPKHVDLWSIYRPRHRERE